MKRKLSFSISGKLLQNKKTGNKVVTKFKTYLKFWTKPAYNIHRSW